MKAIICTKYGPPDLLQLKDVEKPTPDKNELLIKIMATTVNRTDVALLRGKPFLIARLVWGLRKPKQTILGSEFAGIIEAVGKNVSTFKVGDKVFGFNEDGFGSHAQYMICSEDRALTTIPKNVSYEQAAASTEGVFYAYNFINKVNIKHGQRVLVNGATGGIGSAAVQILKYLGAQITAVCNGKDADLVKSLGADRVIDYGKEDFTKEDQKFHFVFDAVGKSSFFKCKGLLEPGGAYLSSELGFLAQNIFLALIKPIIGNKKVIFPMPTDCKGTILFIKKLMEEGKFKAVIDRQYPLEKTGEAYQYVEKGQKIGNVVLTVAHHKS